MFAQPYRGCSHHPLVVIPDLWHPLVPLLPQPHRNMLERIRSHTVIGYAPGNFLDVGTSLAVYASS